MLFNSYSSILKNGIYLNNKIELYKDINFKYIYDNLYGFNFLFWKLFILRTEKQTPYINFKHILWFNFNDISFYKILNSYILKVTSPYIKLKIIKNLNILRLYLIKNYRGKCHIIGKPQRGQRTWSNASTPKRTDMFVKNYVKSKSKNIYLDSWA